MILTNFNLRLECFRTSNTFSGCSVSEMIFKSFPYKFLPIEIWPPKFLPYPTPRGNDLNKLESTIADDASNRVTGFLAVRFLKEDFWRFFSLTSYVKKSPHILVPMLPPGVIIWTNIGMFPQKFSISGQLISEETIFERYQKWFLIILI